MCLSVDGCTLNRCCEQSQSFPDLPTRDSDLTCGDSDAESRIRVIEVDVVVSLR